MDEDWSLQAIVKGSSGDFERIVDDANKDSYLGTIRQGKGEGGSTGGGGSSDYDELEDLYKPYFPPAQQAVVDFHQEQIYSTVCGGRSKQQAVHDQSTATSTYPPVAMATSSSSSAAGGGYSPKYKKRKNQHKRVVIKVSADGLASDMWAWRKYGQKPIKGSPYPRSYYRCSSSKGCQARKQVEQSCTDPGMFILTYTAEHSHSQPTRRNSLAGTVRQKFPSKTQKQPPDDDGDQEPAAPTLFPFKQEIIIKDDEAVQEELMTMRPNAIRSHHQDHAFFMPMPNFDFTEDFFSGLEEFDEFISSDLQPPPSANQFPSHSYRPNALPFI